MLHLLFFICGPQVVIRSILSSWVSYEYFKQKFGGQQNEIKSLSIRWMFTIIHSLVMRWSCNKTPPFWGSLCQTWEWYCNCLWQPLGGCSEFLKYASMSLQKKKKKKKTTLRFVSRLKGTVHLKIKTVIYSSSCFFKSQLADFVLVS